MDASLLIRDTCLNIYMNTITLLLGNVDVVEVEFLKEAVQAQCIKEMVQA